MGYRAQKTDKAMPCHIMTHEIFCCCICILPTINLRLSYLHLVLFDKAGLVGVLNELSSSENQQSGDVTQKAKAKTMHSYIQQAFSSFRKFTAIVLPHGHACA
jgi:hypothetical protein